MANITRRRFSLAALAAASSDAVFGAAGTPPAQPGSSAMGRPGNLSPAVQAAWERYLGRVEQARQHVYTYRFADRPTVQLSAHDIVMQAQALAYNMEMVPHVDYPRFFVHSICEPNVYNAWLWNPDFRYRLAYIDGRRTYRIWGKKGTSRFLGFDIYPLGDFKQGDPVGTPNSVVRDINDLADPATGEFDILVGAVKDGPNAVRVHDAPRVLVAIREALYDWEKEVTAEIHIELADDLPRAPMNHDEAEFIRRLDRAGNLVLWTVNQYGTRSNEIPLKNNGDKINAFGWQHSASEGGYRLASFIDCVYSLADDEALLFGVKKPNDAAHYFGVQLGSVYMQTTDYVYHQSSLNGHQLRLDPDGFARFIISKQDPGVPNWLDVVDRPFGFIQVRYYMQLDSSLIELPTVRIVKISEVRKHLPADTPRITPEQRAASLKSRSRGILRQYGY